MTPPINQDTRLGDLIDAEQAYGLCEALTGLDASDVRHTTYREGRRIGGRGGRDILVHVEVFTSRVLLIAQEHLGDSQSIMIFCVASASPRPLSLSCFSACATFTMLLNRSCRGFNANLSHDLVGSPVCALHMCKL